MKNNIERIKKKFHMRKWLLPAVLGVLVLSFAAGTRIFADNITIGEVDFEAADPNNTYWVESEDQLVALGNATGTDTSDKTFRLKNDITVHKEEYLTTARQGTFAGTLDGNGFMITFNKVDITSVVKDNPDAETPKADNSDVINEGLLFGSMTNKAVVTDLFLNVGDVSYSFENTANPVKTNTQPKVGSYTICDPETPQGKQAIRKLDRYIKEGENYIKDTGNIIFTEANETKTYYYRQTIQNVKVTREPVVTKRNGKTVRFGVICGENAGKIQNVEIRGSRIDAKTNDDSYEVSQAFNTDTTITVYQYYKVELTSDEGEEVDVIKSCEGENYVETANILHLFQYNTTNNTYDYSTPLYQWKKTDNAFNVTNPIYKLKENASTLVFDLTKKEDGTTNTKSGEAPKYATKTANLAVTSGTETPDQGFKYLYTYDAETGVVGSKLYDSEDQPIYFETLDSSTNKPAFDLNHKWKYLNLVPKKADKKTETPLYQSTLINGVSTYYYLYAKDANGYIMDDGGYIPLYVYDVENKEFNITKPLYQTGQNTSCYDLSKTTEDGANVNAKIYKSGRTTAVISQKTELTDKVTVTEGNDNVYLYAYNGKYVDLSKPLYDSNKKALYETLTSEDSKDYFNLKVKGSKIEPLLVPVYANEKIECPLTSKELVKETLYKYLYAYDKNSGRYDFNIPLYKNGDFNIPLYNVADGDKNSFDLGKPSTNGVTDGVKAYQGKTAPVYAEITENTKATWYKEKEANYEVGDCFAEIPAPTGNATVVKLNNLTEQEKSDLNDKLKNLFKTEPEKKSEGTVPGLSVGGVVGIQNGGSISGVVQKVSVNAGTYSTDNKEKYTETQLAAGGIAGTAESTASISDCLIQAVAEVYNAGAVSGKLVPMYADEAKTQAITEEQYVYLYQYDETNQSYNYAVPLYEQNADGTFNTDNPLYQIKEGSTDTFDLTKPVSVATPAGTGEAPVYSDTAQTVDITETSPDGNGKYKYKYAYNTTQNYAELSKSLYDNGRTIYYEMQKDEQYFDLGYKTADSYDNFVPVNAPLTEEESIEVAKKPAGESWVYMLYYHSAGDMYYNNWIFSPATWDFSPATWDLRLPLYSKKDSSGSYVLSKDSGSWRYEYYRDYWLYNVEDKPALRVVPYDEFLARASGKFEKYVTGESWSIKIKIIQDHCYLYAFDGKNVDTMKPLYRNDDSLQSPLYQMLTDKNENISYFNLKVEADGSAEQNLVPVYSDSPKTQAVTATKYLNLYQKVDQNYNYAVPLYAWDSSKSAFDTAKPLYDKSTKDTFDLSKPIAYEGTTAPAYSGETAPVYAESAAADIEVTKEEDGKQKYLYVYDETSGYDLTTKLYDDSGKALYFDVRSTDGKDTKCFDLNQRIIVPMISGEAVTVGGKDVTKEINSKHYYLYPYDGTTVDWTKPLYTDLKNPNDGNAVYKKLTDSSGNEWFNLKMMKLETAADIVGNPVEKPTIATEVTIKRCIIDNGTAGKISGNNLKEKPSNCFVKLPEGSTVSGDNLTVLTVDDFNNAGMTEWKMLKATITGEGADLYLPKWLCKDSNSANFTYKLTLDTKEENAKPILEMKLYKGSEEQTEEITWTKANVGYSYHESLQNGIKKNEFSGLKKAENSPIFLETGNSGYIILTSAYAVDGRYYYQVNYESAQQPVVVYLNNNEYQPIYSDKPAYNAADVSEYIEVSAEQGKEGVEAAFYYTDTEGNLPTVDDSGDVQSGSYKVAGTYDSASGTWKARVPYENATQKMYGLWVVGGKIYPAEMSKEYKDHCRINENTTLEASKYYLDTEEMTPVYGAFEGKLYAEQKVRLANPNKTVNYYYLFSKKQLDISTPEKVNESKLNANLYDRAGYLQVPPYSVGTDTYYFYLFLEKGNMKTGVQEISFTMTNEFNIIPSIAEGSVVINGTSLDLDMAKIKEQFGTPDTKIRYLQTGTDLNLKTLQGVDTRTYDENAGIQFVRSEGGNNCYIYLQAYENKKNICSSVIELNYIFQEWQEAPSASPGTIRVSKGDSPDGATECEIGTKVILGGSTEEKPLIIYALEKNQNLSEEGLTATMVKDDKVLNVLEKVNDRTTEINGVLYVKSNNLWYEMSAGAKVYDEAAGIVLENSTEQEQFYYVEAISFCEGKENSEQVCYVYKVKPMKATETPNPVLSTDNKNPTSVAAGSSLFFQSRIPGVEMYYTTDGSEPAQKETGSTHKYDSEKGILVEGDYNSRFPVRILAIQRSSDGTAISLPSPVGYYVYKITRQEQAAEPTAIPATSAESPARLSPGEKILLSTSTKGASIYYTTDGSEPEIAITGSGSDTKVTVKNGTLYDATKGIVMPEERSGYFTIKAVAVKTGLAVSNTVQLTYSYPDAVLAPYATPASGTVELGTAVSLKNATKDATIYYEVAYGEETPEDPTITSAVYDTAQPFTIEQKTTIKAFAMKDGVKSEIVTYTYTTSAKLSAPTASLESGSIVPRSTMLQLTNSGEGTIYYTTDGSNPADTANTNVVLGSTFLLDGEYGSVITVKACVRKSGSSVSDVATFTYQISKYQGGVTSDVESGSELTQGATVNLISDVSDAVVYYTVDGSMPGNGSTSGTMITLNQEPGSIVTVKALAVPKNLTLSSAGNTTAIFTYKLKEAIASPTATPAGGVLSTTANVRLSAPEGKIYYTTDGTEPTAASTLYTGPITVNKTMVIKAVAITENGDNSAVAVFEYTAAMRAVKPEASMESQNVEPGTVVQLSTQTSDAVIYYSTDGTEPTLDNLDSLLVYDGEGISVNRTITLQAVAYKEGLQLSRVASYVYEVTTIPAVEAKKKAEQEAAANARKETDATGLASKKEHALDGGTFAGGILLTEEQNDTQVAADADAFASETTLVTRELAADKTASENLHALMGDTYEILRLYDMRLYDKETTVQPNGQVEIGIPIPEGYEDAALAIVYIDDDNQIHPCETWRSGDKLYTLTDHFSLYGLAGVPLEEKGGIRIDIAMAAAGTAGTVAVAGMIFMICQLVRRRKRRKMGHQ